MKIQLSSQEINRINSYINNINSTEKVIPNQTDSLLMHLLKLSKYVDNKYNILSFSEFGQDNIIIDLFNGKKNGFFLDIGCGHPTNKSNSFTLEKNLGWKGVAFDTKNLWDELWKTLRTNSTKYGTIQSKLTPIGVNYLNVLPKNIQIDYVSLDIDGGENEVFKELMKFESKPLVFTIEHDIYKRNRLQKIKETHRLLQESGYRYLVSIGVDDVFIFNESTIYENNVNYGYSIKEIFSI